MILDQSDPTGLGLFSRCARNQACKTTKTRPQTANSKKSMNSPQIHQNRRQKTINQDMFSKQQSRQQRQRKYKKQHTPAVGQYNNVILKQKPKLVWDVVKLYHKKSRNMKQLQQLKQKIKNHRGNRHYKSLDFEGTDYFDQNNNNFDSTTIVINDPTQNNNQNPLQNTHSYSNNITTIITQPSHNKSNKNLLTQSFSHNRKLKSSIITGDNNNEHYDTQKQYQDLQQQWPQGLKKKSIINKKICMVDMSRTTGRQFLTTKGNNNNNTKQSNPTITDNNTTNTFNNINKQSSQSQLIQLNKSIQKIKPRTKPNYYFKKMLGRKDQTNKLNAGNVYDCNIDLVKPKRSALLNFGIVKGRNDQSLKKCYQRSGYSYTHYDFNQYVWKSTSTVFPNTKKGLIPFDKQR